MRKTKLLVIDTAGRDFGKAFLLTEMSSAKAEKWAGRALVALLKSGLEVPEETAQAGLAGLASMGMRALTNLHWDSIEPLLDQMMSCVQFVPNPSVPSVVRDIMDMADDIEEVSTRFLIRKEVLELHLGFSIADKLSTSGMSAPQIAM